jgi:hypothetical protein
VDTEGAGTLRFRLCEASYSTSKPRPDRLLCERIDGHATIQGMQMPTTAYTNSVKSRADLGCDPTGRSSDDDTDYQTAYQSFRTVVVNGGRA